MYVLQLTATDTDTFSKDRLQFMTNDLPWNGSLAVQPSRGTALETHFKMTATDWVDSDMPLAYTFKLHSPISGRTTILVSQTANPVYVATLPPTADTMPDQIEVNVLDTFGAAATARSDVQVQPYVPSGGWLDAVATLSRPSTVAQDDSTSLEATTQVLGALSMSLNVATTTDNETDVAEMSAARSHLVSALSNAVQSTSLSTSLRTQVSSCLDAATQVPEQMTASTVESAIDVLASIVPSARVSAVAQSTRSSTSVSNQELRLRGVMMAPWPRPAVGINSSAARTAAPRTRTTTILALSSWPS
jgi:hypothetical protein